MAFREAGRGAFFPSPRCRFYTLLLAIFFAKVVELPPTALFLVNTTLSFSAVEVWNDCFSVFYKRSLCCFSLSPERRVFYFEGRPFFSFFAQGLGTINFSLGLSRSLIPSLYLEISPFPIQSPAFFPPFGGSVLSLFSFIVFLSSLLDTFEWMPCRECDSRASNLSPTRCRPDPWLPALIACQGRSFRPRPLPAASPRWAGSEQHLLFPAIACRDLHTPIVEARLERSVDPREPRFVGLRSLVIGPMGF